MKYLIYLLKKHLLKTFILTNLEIINTINKIKV